MKIITDPKEPVGFPTSAAIGNFDGVHLGHKAIIKRLREELGQTKSCIITFDPHPQKVLAKKDIPLIMPFSERLERLEREGVDLLVRLSFTKDLSLLHAEEFVRRILVRSLNIKRIIVGPDFSFGYKRTGNFDLLRSMGKELGFETLKAEPVTIGDTIISSSNIRECLRNGSVKEASSMLGYRYYMKGRVVEGEKRGREIGFPTINLDTEWEFYPRTGVYATYVHLNDVIYKSITNIGYRPTFGKSELLIESHLFNFSGNIYNQHVKLEFVDRIRDERKFENVDALVSQIREDVKKVESVLSG